MRAGVLVIPVLLFALTSTPSSATANTGSAPDDLRVDRQRIERRILELSEFGGNPEGGVTRVAYSDADLAGRDYVMRLMRQAGLVVRVDPAGNIIGRREGKDPSLPVIMTGSHIDSVPGGGNYDGDVGVIGAIECLQVLQEASIATRHPIEVIVFTDEEGGLVGSRALAGELSEESLDIVSHSGRTIREGIRFLGGDPERISEAAYDRDRLEAFLELHIEQGGSLEEAGIQIGVVEGIVGIRWWDVTIEGFANHAGTTPMNRRQDALLSAAHLTVAVNRVVTETEGRQVGTVGRIRAEPGAPNVIPGRVVMSLELRDLSDSKISTLFERIRVQARRIAEETGTTIRFAPIDATAVPALTDEWIRSIISDSARSLGLTHRLMPSGAGHDAQDMARITPTGMIFVPSIGGISHSPEEFTRPEDMANGANVLLHSILRIDREVP